MGFFTHGKYNVYISRSLSFVKLFCFKCEERDILVLEYMELKSNSIKITTAKNVLASISVHDSYLSNSLFLKTEKSIL